MKQTLLVLILVLMGISSKAQTVKSENMLFMADSVKFSMDTVYQGGGMFVSSFCDFATDSAPTLFNTYSIKKEDCHNHVLAVTRYAPTKDVATFNAQSKIVKVRFTLDSCDAPDFIKVVSSTWFGNTGLIYYVDDKTIAVLTDDGYTSLRILDLGHGKFVPTLYSVVTSRKVVTYLYSLNVQRYIQKPKSIVSNKVVKRKITKKPQKKK